MTPTGAITNPRTLADIRGILRGKEKFEAVISSCVANITYDAIEAVMTVAFKQRGTYNYFNVSPTEFLDFHGSSSKGTYFNLYIRDRYSYERIA